MAKITRMDIDPITTRWKYKDRILIQERKGTTICPYSVYHYKDDYYETRYHFTPHSGDRSARHSTVDGIIHTNLSLKEWTTLIGFIDSDYEQ